MTARTALRTIYALILSLTSIAGNAQTNASPRSLLPKSVAVSPTAAATYDKLPLNFEPNMGQTSSQVQWLARGADFTLYLSGHDTVLEMNKIIPAQQGESAQPTISSSALRMNLIGARTAESVRGDERLPGKANYFTGKNPSMWQRDVPMYGKVRLQEVYPGINLIYYGHEGRLEYDFVVAAGADASAVRLKFDGATAKIAANGDLVLPIAGTEVRFDKPVVYQMKDGIRQPIDGSFELAENQQVTFKLGAYDRSRELVIDPTLLFLGSLGTGNQQSLANGMAVDSLGEIILTGITNDLAFPTTTGVLDPSCTNASPAFAANYHRCGASSASSGFVTKISSDGKSLVYSTYLHGLSGQEYGEAVAVDALGDAYVLGSTSSNDFPITTDAYQSFCQPYFPPNGFAQPQTYLPEESTCDGYFAGGGTQFVYQGPALFIAKLNPSGSQILYGTFFGGTVPTVPVALALDSSNNIYFTGFLQNALTASNAYPNAGNVAFPVTASAYQSAGVGLQAATLSKLSADGHTLLYSTLMGTLDTQTYFGYTEPLSLAVGQNGMAYIGGITLTSAFPTTTGVVRPSCVPNASNNGDCAAYTGFLSAFDTTQAGAASLVYSTYIGGTEVAASNTPQNEVLGLAVDGSNNVYATGYTLNIDFPTTSGVFQPTCVQSSTASTCSAAFLTKINPTGTAYVWSTFFNGPTSSSSSGSSIALDAKGQVYLYGYNNDYGNDLPEVNPVQPYIGASVAYVATFSPDASKLLFATWLGNTSTTTLSNTYPINNNGIALDATANIYFAAYGADSGSFVTTSGTYATAGTAGFNRSYFGKISPVLAPTGATLAISPFTASTGQSVTFTATIAGTTQTTPAPTGTVTLTNASTTPATVLGTITLGGSGTGTYTTSSLLAGTYSVTASYAGDSVYDVSTSTAQPLTINSLPGTTTALAISPTGPLTYGQPVTLTATVTQTGGGIPTGSVNFTLGGVAFGAGTLNSSGVATLTTVLPAGGGSLGANYAGSSSSSSSGSSVLAVTVAKAALTVTAANASRVVGSANPTLTGTVVGTVNGDILSATYSTVATSSSAVGTYPIVPAVTGTNIGNYSVTLVNGTLTVLAPSATTTVLISTASTSIVGASVAFTATTTSTGSPAPTGTVTFKDGAITLGTGTLNGSGVATYTTTALALGSHSITASYAGDANNVASVSGVVTVVITAGAADFSLSIAPTSGSSIAGVSTTATVTITPVNGFNAPTSLACTGLPSYAACSFKPASLTPNGTAAATSTLTITTNVKGALAALHLASSGSHPATGKRQALAITGTLACLFILPLAGRRNRRVRLLLATCIPLLLLTIASAGLSGCGLNNNTPKGTYAVTVTGTSGSLSHSATYTITVN